MSFKVCKYTKDERWVKSGVKMESLLTSIRLSRFLFRFAYMALFSCVSSCSVVSWRAEEKWEMRATGD
jgi:hypothetical protein